MVVNLSMPGVNERNEYYREEWNRLHTQKHSNKSFAVAGYAQFHVLTKASYRANKTKKIKLNKKQQINNAVMRWLFIAVSTNHIDTPQTKWTTT